MDAIKMAAIALVVGVIGPLFWLGVKVFENWLWLSVGRLKDRLRAAKAEKAAAAKQRLLK